jgi:hypothetical protein
VGVGVGLGLGLEFEPEPELVPEPEVGVLLFDEVFGSAPHPAMAIATTSERTNLTDLYIGPSKAASAQSFAERSNPTAGSRRHLVSTEKWDQS